MTRKTNFDNIRLKYFNQSKNNISRIIVDPPDLDGKASVTIINNDIKKTFPVQIDEALDIMFRLKTIYFTGSVDRSSK